MKRVFLQKNKEKSLLRFHPWVFSGAIGRTEHGIENGDIVEVCAADGSFMALGHYHNSTIAVRIFSFEPCVPDHIFWRQKVERALQLRTALGLAGSKETTMFRLVNGEGDGLPGLVIDLYGANAVVQFHSVGMYRLKETFSQIIRELFPDIRSIYSKSSLTIADSGGESHDELLHGTLEPTVALENGIPFHIDIAGGQKTGFFLDQRESRASVGKYAHGRTILNMFCYSGGFSAYALRGGALHVDSVDISRKAIDFTDRNIALLGESAESRHASYCEDVFSFLDRMPQGRYDLIVLDPPAFAKHQRTKEQGLKGYRNINRKALEKIHPGGLLFTFSCSQAVSMDDFRTVIFSAAAMERKNVRVLHHLQHAPDHPYSIYHPEGNYLKGLLLSVG